MKPMASSWQTKSAWQTEPSSEQDDNDSGAEDLEDSTLEFDYKLEAEADDAKIQFGIFPRFQSGRNCDGLAIGEAAQIQHSYQVNGSEGWPGASNLPNMTFVKDTTYHFKIVTVGNTLTAYVDDTMLTTFTTNSTITNGGYGFRIWGQPNTGNHKKNVTVSNLTRKKCITSTLGSKGVNLKEAEWGSEDVTIPVTFGEGDSVKSIISGPETTDMTLVRTALRSRQTSGPMWPSQETGQTLASI